MDVHSREQRRRNMAAIRGTDTGPEMKVRRLVHRMGYRYGLHCKDLQGKPDLVFRSRRKIIFVHGCYWHMHECPLGSVVPRTNAEFWRAKRTGNVERDRRNEQALARKGWEVLLVWECETKEPAKLLQRIKGFLERDISA
jgi:DNA mismatch endonuclease (patch repair protein)